MGGSSAQQQWTYSTTSKSSGWSPSGSAVETSTAPEIMLVAAQGVVSAMAAVDSATVLGLTADLANSVAATAHSTAAPGHISRLKGLRQ